MGQRLSVSLRFRFFAVLGGLLIVAMIALAVISKWLIFPALQAEERTAVQRELDRATRSLMLNQENLLAQARDWSHWDDTYRFIEGTNPRYRDVNFSQQMFEDMNYHLMAFFTLQGDVHFLAGLEPTTGRYQTCTAAVDRCAWMAPWVETMQSAMAEHVDPTALYIEQWPAIVAASQILHTDESGPPNGWLFKVRAMDDAWLERMVDYTGLPLSLDVTPYDADQPTELTFSGDQVRASQQFPAFGTNEAVSLGIELNRVQYLASLTTFRYILAWTAGLMLLVIGMVLLLLERMVLKPLRQLTALTQPSCPSPDSDHLTLRRDEIGLLARAYLEQLTCQQQLNAELLRMSTHDSLTELPNRRLFDQRLIDGVSHANEHNVPLAVMMLDIDHFKLYNDDYGHQQGDECLKKVATALQNEAIRHDVLIARTGGEEFSALLPGATPQQAKAFAHALIHAVDQLRLPHGTSPVSHYVTISVGIGMLSDSETLLPSAVMATADQALYLAKAQGRHRVVLFEPPLASCPVSKQNTPS
ncbi:diguanylate cyclase [Halomonas sp. CnH100-B]|uniref:diguanylate cyclase n=1 Tax=Vreelandella aquamarina TaxID=77097 RepID=A0A857GL17_9GAMM|nr:MULTISPECIES: diguanylate cyclase [Halomonas]MCO7228099.1 diguanylate cyclase [Halomonas sp. CnH100-B]QHD49969.1 response regulator [Halomonas meridiana]